MKETYINLFSIYETDKEIEKFHERMDDFLKSDIHLPVIIKLKDQGVNISYKYNELICVDRDKLKRNIVLVFGNPSPHSIAEEIMFSYEGSLFKTHRVWKVLNDIGIINMNNTLLLQSANDYRIKGIERNNQIVSGKASDKFNLFFLSYFTLPSPSSTLKWSGVAGLKRLFGKKGWEKIQEIETRRFIQNLNDLPKKSKILVFQKDAYLNILQNTSDLDIELISPTRLWYSRKVKNKFLTIVNSSSNAKNLHPNVS